MKKLPLASVLCLVLLSGGASLRAQAPDPTPVPASSPAPTPVPTPMLLNKESLKALAGSYAVPGREPAIIKVHGEIGLTATLADGTTYELFPTQGTTFSIQGVDGGTSEFRRNAEGKYDEIVTSVNGETFTALRVPEKPAVGASITKEMLTALTGRFAVPGREPATISMHGENELTATLADGTTYVLTPRTGIVFDIQGVDGGTSEFRRNAVGKYDEIATSVNGETFTAARVPEKSAASTPSTKETLKAMTGKYSAPDGVTVTISQRGENGLTATLSDGTVSELTPREGTSFGIQGTEGTADFHRDGAGEFDKIVGTFPNATYTATRVH